MTNTKPLRLSTAFSQVLKEERERLGMTIEEAAEKASVSVNVWTDVENEIRPAWMDEVYKFPKALGIDPLVMLDKVSERREQLLREHSP